mgnify:CR=1 FL=1|tara:strand:+ start:381 stop:578 length:198 start_codon:yes stop_codon:yes gene_type:complete
MGIRRVISMVYVEKQLLSGVRRRKRGGDGMNWAIHRAYYIDLLKKGWPLKKAYDEAIRLSVEVTA